jgi:hypothetical protein
MRGNHDVHAVQAKTKVGVGLPGSQPPHVLISRPKIPAEPPGSLAVRNYEGIGGHTLKLKRLHYTFHYSIAADKLSSARPIAERIMEADARITDVVHTLDDPVEYLRGIVGSFFAYPFDKKEAVVRIGISGKGMIPNYCIEQYCASISDRLEVGSAALEISTNIELRHCFHGRNHKEILDDSFIGGNWSSASMKLAEVQTLLGQLRAYKKTKH